MLGTLLDNTHLCSSLTMQREWIEQQQKTQGVLEKAWPEHIYENFFIVVSSRCWHGADTFRRQAGQDD